MDTYPVSFSWRSFTWCFFQTQKYNPIRGIVDFIMPRPQRIHSQIFDKFWINSALALIFIVDKHRPLDFMASWISNAITTWRLICVKRIWPTEGGKRDRVSYRLGDLGLSSHHVRPLDRADGLKIYEWNYNGRRMRVGAGADHRTACLNNIAWT